MSSAAKFFVKPPNPPYLGVSQGSPEMRQRINRHTFSWGILSAASVLKALALALESRVSDPRKSPM